MCCIDKWIFKYNLDCSFFIALQLASFYSKAYGGYCLSSVDIDRSDTEAHAFYHYAVP